MTTTADINGRGVYDGSREALTTLADDAELLVVGPRIRTGGQRV